MERRTKGEGTFIRRADGGWIYRKSAGRKPDGNRRYLTVSGKTKTQCHTEMRKLESMKEMDGVGQLQQRVYGSVVAIPKTTVTVARLCEMHLEYQVFNEELKPKSIDRREVTNQHISAYRLGQTNAAMVTSGDVEDYVNHLVKCTTLSSSSIKKAVDVLSAAYNWSIRCGELTENPVLPVRSLLKKRIMAKSDKADEDADVVVFSEAEENRFQQECLRKCNNGKPANHAGVYLLLLLLTGMRVGELIALTWADVDMEYRCIRINKDRETVKNRAADACAGNRYITVVGTTKNQKARTIRLSAEAWDILMDIRAKSRFRKPEDLIVRTSTGTPHTTHQLEHIAHTIYCRIGMEGYRYSLHVLRRTFATNMYEAGARTKEIASYIGDLESTTAKYYIGVRKKVRGLDNKVRHIVELPAFPD